MALINEAQLKKFQIKMQNELTQLISEMKTLADPEVKLNYMYAGGDGDSGDEAAANSVIDTQSALMKMQIEQTQDLTAALKRIQTNVYGICIDCGDEISLERLSAYPTAKRCFKCQQIKEMAS